MESPSENKESTTRGCLTLNDKIYPVYDGHNTVGRNPDAVINIKNLNVSKYHAVITVIDQELHFISDFKSSNGTVLDSKKLTPLHLYKLNNGSSIKFGDVFCTYKKLEGEKNFSKNINETQQFSENFYTTSTQEVHLPNGPDGINFNEMPTQIFAEKELSINEMPTQVHHFPGFNDESSNDSIDFITMQKSTESQMFQCDKNSNSLIESDEETETVDKNPTQTSSNSSQIRPVKINSNKIVDSETEDEVASQIYPVRKTGKNVIDSDSDTEEYLNSSDQKSKYHISDDSETDIEDNIHKEENLNETDIVPKSEISKEQEENSMVSFRLELSESADCTNEDSFKQNKISKKVLPQDHLYCQALTQTQDNLHENEKLALESASKEKKINVAETGDENVQRNEQPDLMISKTIQKNEEKQYLQEKSKEEANAPEAKEKVETAAVLPDSDSDTTSSLPLPKDEELNEDVFNQPTQQFNFDFITDAKIVDHEQNEDKEKQNKDQDKKDENIKETSFQTKEILDHSSSANVKDKKSADEMKNEDTSGKEDDIFFLPTQTLDYFGSRKPVSTREFNPDPASSQTEDDIFLQSTQVIPTADSVTPTNKNKEKEIFLQPTRSLVNLYRDEAHSPQTEHSSGNKNESLKTTQTLEYLPNNDFTRNTSLTAAETGEENLQRNKQTDLIVSKTIKEIIQKNEEKQYSQEKSEEEEANIPEAKEKVETAAVLPNNDSDMTSSHPLPKNEQNEDVFDQPTQQLNFDFINDAKIVDHEQNEDKEKQNEDQDKKDENIKEASFQTKEILDQSSSANVQDKKCTDEMKNEDTSGKEGDIFLLPTQTLDYFGSPKPVNTKEFNAEPTSSKTEDDIFLQSTQVIPTSESVTPANNKDKEKEIFFQPTQALENLYGDEARSPQTEHSESLETTQTLESLLNDDFTRNTSLTSRSSLPEKDDEDIVLSPTQAMELLHADDKITEMEKSLSSKDEEADNMFLPPTQALENLLSDAGPSGKNYDVFLPPNPFKDPSTLKKSNQKPPKEDDDSFILPPTQAMEILHEDGTHFNKIEDQLHDIFASQSLLCTQQLVDVLNTSRGDDIIDDSIIQEETRRSLSLRKSAPLSEESVKKILAGDEENEDLELLNVNRSKVKTYSTKKEKTKEIKQIQEEKEAGNSKSSIIDTQADDGENKSNRGTTSRKGRRKQELEVVEGTNEENIYVDKTVKEKDNKGRKLKRNLIAFDDENKPEGREANDLKGKKQNKKGRESSVESSGSDVGTRKTRNKRQVNNDGFESGKNEARTQKKGSTIELKKQESQDSSESKRRRGTSIKSTASDDGESNAKCSQTSSQNSSSDGRSKKERRNQIDEDEKIDREKAENNKKQDFEKSGDNQRRGRSKTKSHEFNDGDSKKTSQNTNPNGENKERSKQKQIINDLEVENDQGVDKKSTVLDSEKTRRGNSKQSTTRESSVESTKNNSQNSNSDDKVTRGNRQEKVSRDQAEEQDKIEEPESSLERRGRRNSRQGETKSRGSSVESSRDGSQNSNCHGSNRRDRRKKISDEETKKDKTADVKKQEMNTNEEKRIMGRRKQIASEPEEHINIEPDKQKNKTRGRKKQTETKKMDDRTESKEGTPKSSTSNTRKANKRKQDSDEPPETPTKKKLQDVNTKKSKQEGPATPRKRTLKFSSNDSEDDFITKVPKVEIPVTRQSTRKKKDPGENSEEIISISSSSSEQSIITISSSASIASAKKPRRLSANSRRQKREIGEEEGQKQKTMEKATPIPTTPQRSKRVLKPKVVFTMMDNPELESLIRTLGGCVVDTVDTCTVLVTESVKRSQKLLCAVGQGKPICSPQWLYACKKAFSFVDPWDYILIDKEAEKKWNFSLRESLRRGGASKLLQNYTFQIIVNNAADVLKGAIESCGGKCVNKNLAKCTTDHLIIVSTANNKVKYSKIVQQNKKIKVVETEAIFDGTLRQEFSFDDFLLT